MKRNKHFKKEFIIAILFVLITTSLSLVLLENNRFVYEIGLIEQATWNTLEGNFYYSISNGGNHFARHNSPILFLFLPIYYLFSNIIIFTIFTNIFIALSSIVIYKFSNKILKNRIYAIIFQISFLVFPSFLYSNIRSFHPIMLSVFFISIALYFFYENKTKLFLLFTLIAMLTNETVSLMVIMLGIFVLIKKQKKTGLILIIIGLLWFKISTGIIMPHFSESKEYPYFEELYGHLGNDIGEVILSTIKNPRYAFSYGEAELKTKYLKQVFQHNIFLSLFSPLILIATIPVFVQNLLSGSGYKYNILAHYIYPIIPIIFFASIKGFNKLLIIIKKKRINIDPKIIIIILLLIGLTNGLNNGVKNLVRDNCEALSFSKNCMLTDDIIGNSPKEKNQVLNKFVNIIPKESSVMVQNHLFSKLSDRKETYLLLWFYNSQEVDYVIIDKDGYNSLEHDLNNYLKQKMESKNYKLIFEEKDVYLFQKITS